MAKGIKVDGWLDRKAAAEYIGLSDFWLEKHAGSIDGPRHIKHGRKCWYRRDDLDEWMSQQKNLEGSGAGGRTALDSLWEMGRKRRVETPNVIELESRYRNEHGAPITTSRERKRQVWERLCKTFDARQRKMLDEMRAV